MLSVLGGRASAKKTKVLEEDKIEKPAEEPYPDLHTLGYAMAIDDEKEEELAAKKEALLLEIRALRKKQLPELEVLAEAAYPLLGVENRAFVDRVRTNGVGFNSRGPNRGYVVWLMVRWLLTLIFSVLNWLVKATRIARTAC